MLNAVLNVILNLFQDLSADRNSEGSRWDAETSSAWHLESFVIYTLILGKPIQYLCSFVKNTHNSSLIAHCSKASGRREARWANSRGFLNPWNNWQDKEIASGRRGTATLTTDSRLCRRRYYVIVKYRGLESPRLLKSPSLTLSKLLTLGIAQASLALLSLNRNFPDVFRS